MADTTSKRIAYLDWLRGFACLVMFQTHCYDSWLGGAARSSGFFKLSQLGGTLPAPLFLFLAGVSFALVTERLRRKGASPDEIARATVLRGGEILFFGLLFRLQEFVLGQPWAPWTDLLRVDVLNVIGVSLMMLGVACRIAASGAPTGLAQLRRATIVAGVLGAGAIACLTPLLWTSWSPQALPWWLESYVNGVHTFGKPQPWLFPVFPWAAFAFAGLAVGSLLQSDWVRKHEASALTLVGSGGAALIVLALRLDASAVHLYSAYDFWHTSPNFFLVRVGVVSMVMLMAYAWCRWGAGEWGFSPLIEMGKCSLLVYWVHIEFVYGRFSILPKGSEGIGMATIGLAVIFAAMTALATIRNRFPKWRPQMLALVRGAERT